MNNNLFIKMIRPFIKEKHSNLSFEDNNLSFVSLKGGSDATLYLFTFHNYAYVIRILPSLDRAEERLRQINLATLAGDIGAGPKILYVDPEMKFVIMDYISDRTADPKDFQDIPRMAQFANFLREIHSASLSFPLAQSPFKRFHNFVSRAEKNQIIPPKQMPEIISLMIKLEKLFASNPLKNVPSHLDLHALNILISENRFYLVDWVNGGLSDPNFDLATFCVFQNLNTVQQKMFLTTYYQRPPTDEEWHRFILTQPIRPLVIAAAQLSMIKNHPFSNRFDEMLESGDLPSYYDLSPENLNKPNWLFGLRAFKMALEIIDSDNFKLALER